MANISVNYIGHSGFLLETEDCLILFDYYRGSLAPLDAAGPDKPLYVFASHAHADHFNPEIFKLADHGRDVTYLLSFDIRGSRAIPKKYSGIIRYLDAGRTYDIQGLGSVSTLISTDQGIAVLIKTPDAVIYHAGDLHWWDWPGDDPASLADQERVFKGEIAKLAEMTAGKAIDLAMIVVDDRLETGEMTGPSWFLNNCRARHVFPMHFWHDRKVVRRFIELAETLQPEIQIHDTADNQYWEVEL